MDIPLGNLAFFAAVGFFSGGASALHGKSSAPKAWDVVGRCLGGAVAGLVAGGASAAGGPTLALVLAAAFGWMGPAAAFRLVNLPAGKSPPKQGDPP